MTVSPLAEKKTFFQNVNDAPPDAVFGLIGAFHADPRPQKVNGMLERNSTPSGVVKPSYFILSGAGERPPLAEEEPPPFKEEIFNLLVGIYKNELLQDANGHPGEIRQKNLDYVVDSIRAVI